MLAARANARMRGLKHESHPPPCPTGTSPAMKKLDLLVERLAPSNISVLILGETGTGKEVLADRVHARSPRGHRPLLKINCAALSESLLESELFGFERGAFTGADQAKPGLLETVDGGTVFLDEVGELPASLQAKLLRVIESRQVMRVGGLQPRPIDVRFLSATNRDLELEISRGRFRADLYFRLNGASLVLPPLRERRDEILPLARLFAERYAQDYGARRPPPITAEAAEAFERYAWPGNIRELRNVVERAVLLAGDDPVALEHLPLEKLGTTLITRDQVDLESLGDERSFDLEPISSSMTEVRTTPMVPPLLRGEAESPPVLRAEIDELERRRILEALEQSAGNQTQAARLLGISRRTLVTRLDEYEVARPRKGKR
ncbi:MAG: sigma 54-interacting transcriptional regulator [Deltaproteobacteria bacterium]|nr:sigma 54-interacting transcriptional regulator [Deltaproteobacteria bacterium]